ncbi:KDEL-tailed cysteine endopeptidase CEP1 [Hordeum vulgare]|nr:KDEL-tailed cysteine endopeptidase CEP1 [Hordeum vulgare]
MQVATSVDITDMDLASEKSLWALYDRWCEHHNVVHDLSEKARRFSVFEENARMIHQFNQGNAPYKLSLNLFGDMTDEEVDDGYGRCSTPLPNSGKRRQGQVTHGVVAGRANYPMYVDWRMTGYDQRPSAVTNVKIQRGCGSCWAFSAIAAVEGINSIRTRKLVSLSAQQLLDCDKKSGGCSGGNPILAFQYMMGHVGISTEALTTRTLLMSTATAGCRNERTLLSPSTASRRCREMTRWRCCRRWRPNPSLWWLTRRPSGATVEACFVGPCGTNGTHAMTVVGYGTTDETNPIDYWIVKNSWGPKWGENGYIRLARGVDGRTKEGICGILMEASYPVKN